jgi:hypothetical protein
MVHAGRYRVRSSGISAFPGVYFGCRSLPGARDGSKYRIFSLVNAVLLQKLPVREPDRLVIFTIGPRSPLANHWISYRTFEETRRRNAVFSAYAAQATIATAIDSKETSERVLGELVSGDFSRHLASVRFWGGC